MLKRTLQRSTFWAGLSLLIAGIGQIAADGDWARGAQSIITALGLLGLGSRLRDLGLLTNGGKSPSNGD